jgi:hypothetical protein
MVPAKDCMSLDQCRKGVLEMYKKNEKKNEPQMSTERLAPMPSPLSMSITPYLAELSSAA